MGVVEGGRILVEVSGRCCSLGDEYSIGTFVICKLNRVLPCLFTQIDISMAGSEADPRCQVESG